ncbi:EF-P beta-lysylation protein EpmB [Candidatus Aerophobetes bacterium]|uniref:L-lysine 2,3-aminomutase n=1 Tax=Aerophobetes bacterium TaxID=2030807 RepID=A0A2A4X101_UNCAE|nr:MAG: EF-P beta-lysylation protein EpmB [Candidatus Aerophobetes bacterium]
MDKPPLSWKQILRQNFTKLEPLLDFLSLDPAKRALCLNLPPFPLNLPRRLAEKIEKNNIEDPLFLQFVPLIKEKQSSQDFILDPVCDKDFTKAPKLLHKYPGRVLLLVTSACAMHCRFCFRQNFPYETEDKSFEKELFYIASNPTIHEVILSGGDPLSLSTHKLQPLLKAIDQIKHVKIIRFHSRFIIGVPERISPNFLTQLKTLSKTLVFVLHINHATEIDSAVIESVKKLKSIGATVLAQSVLLNGVNNSKKALKELFLTLVTAGITPYYLHKLDKVKGAHHFNSEIAPAKKWLLELRDEMPGYAVPHFVEEIPHKQSKTLISV